MRAQRAGTLTLFFLLLGARVGAIPLRDMAGWVGDELQPVHIGSSEACTAPPGVKASGTAAQAPTTVSPVRVTPLENARAEPAIVTAASLAEGARCLAAIERESMTERDFAHWARENEISAEGIVAAISTEICDGGFPRFTGTLRTLSAGLLEVAGEDLERLEAIPPAGRAHLAVYLGNLGRNDDVKALLSSMSPDELGKVNGVPYYVYVAEQLVMLENSLRVAIWALKTHGERCGAAERAFTSWYLLRACQLQGGPVLVRDEFLPWAEETLEMPGSEKGWGRALSTLLRAYDYIRETDRGATRGYHWLNEGRQRGVSQRRLASPQLRLASILIDGHRFHEAADMLRAPIDAGPPGLAQRAQAELCSLAANHADADLGPVDILPATLEHVSPEQLVVRTAFGEHGTAWVVLRGNPTLRVTAASCDLPFVSCTVCEKWLRHGTRISQVQVEVFKSDKPGSFAEELLIRTNDANTAQVRVPLTIDIPNPITARPDSLFFGFVRPGKTAACAATLTSDMPFRVTDVTVDNPELIQVGMERQTDSRYLIEGTLHAPRKTGIITGAITISTDVEAQPTVLIEYYGDLRARRVGPQADMPTAGSGTPESAIAQSAFALASGSSAELLPRRTRGAA